MTVVRLARQRRIEAAITAGTRLLLLLMLGRLLHLMLLLLLLKELLELQLMGRDLLLKLYVGEDRLGIKTRHACDTKIRQEAQVLVESLLWQRLLGILLAVR